MQPRNSPLTVAPPVAAPPFASYAQVARMLMPLVRKVVFHDPTGRSLWTTDGIEEAELSMQVQIMAARFVSADPREQHLHKHSELAEPVHVFPVRHANGSLVGVMALQFGELPTTAAYRQYTTVQRMLSPLLDIIRHDWAAAPIAPAAASAAAPEAVKVVITDTTPVSEVKPAAVAKPTSVAALPAVLRRMLIDATEAGSAAFGTLVLPGQSFLLSHRLCADESDLNVSAATDAVRAQLLRWMTVRNEPLIMNVHDPAQPLFSSYKLLAVPIRVNGGPLLALLVLFRRRQDKDFLPSDLHLVEQITAQLPAAALTKLQKPRKLPAPPAAPSPPPKPTVLGSADAQVAGVVSAPIVASEPGVPSQQSEDDALLATTLITGLPLPPLAERLRVALTHHAFDLHVQLIAPLRGYEQPERFEVLLRLPDKRGMLMPATFLGTAQDSGLMPELDRWVVQQLLRRLRYERRLGRSSQHEFCINLSLASLLDEHFAGLLIADLGDDLVPGQIVFEVSELVAISHPQALKTLGNRLHGVGCRIALDNCRIGPDIFDLVQQLPVNCLKIDGSLIRQMGVNAQVDSMVRNMAQLAQTRGLESVAEQVESQAVCSTLISAGFDFAQGFHLQPPESLAKRFG